jgi:exonuclease VII large subunit
MDIFNQYDVICFFRGGREDQGMSIFRDLALFEKIASANTFTVTGLCHDIDHPVIELLVDEVFSVPKAFAKTILARNKAYFDELNEAAAGIKTALRIVHQKIVDALFSALLLVGGEIRKSANLIRSQVDHTCNGISNNQTSIGRRVNDELATLQICASTAIASSIERVGVALDDQSHEITALHTAIHNKLHLKQKRIDWGTF